MLSLNAPDRSCTLCEPGAGLLYLRRKSTVPAIERILEPMNTLYDPVRLPELSI